jgi:hypothetical protein
MSLKHKSTPNFKNIDNIEDNAVKEYVELFKVYIKRHKMDTNNYENVIKVLSNSLLSNKDDTYDYIFDKIDSKL